MVLAGVLETSTKKYKARSPAGSFTPSPRKSGIACVCVLGRGSEGSSSPRIYFCMLINVKQLNSMFFPLHSQQASCNPVLSDCYFASKLEVWVQVIDQSGVTTMECANTENELRFTSIEQRGKQKIKAKHRPVSV